MKTDSFKEMCRLIDYTRRSYLLREWENICEGKSIAKLSNRHIHYLTMIRFQLPCNLKTIMQVTGLSSSAASTFVEKMVQAGLVTREANEDDRRNVRIIPNEETMRIFQEVDRRLDSLIDFLAEGCTPEEIKAVEQAGELVCRKILAKKYWIDSEQARDKSKN